MKIMQQISKLVDKLMSMVQNFFFGPKGLLDSIVPLDLIKEFLDSVGSIASVAGSLSQMAGGFKAIDGLTSQLTSFSSQGMSALNNPMAIANSYLPSSAGTLLGGGLNPNNIMQSLGGIGGSSSNANLALSVLRDPSQALSKFIPSSISSQLGKLNQIPGLGMVGNLGYGLGPALDSLKSGVISKTLSQFAQQSNILAPGLNQQSSSPIFDPLIANKVAITPAVMNPTIPTVQGVPVQTTPASSIFSQNA